MVCQYWRICHRLGAWISDLSCKRRHDDDSIAWWRNKKTPTNRYHTRKAHARRIQKAQERDRRRNTMELAGFEVGIVERIQREPAFAVALMTEVNEAFAEDENNIAKGILRVLTFGTVGFSALAQSLSLTAETLQQLLSQDATPDAASLRAVEKALRLALGVAAS